MKNLKIFLVLIILFNLMIFLTTSFNFALAATGKDLGTSITEELERAGAGAGYGQYRSPTEIAGLIINAVLTIVGIIFVVLIIYGGFTWMTAGGNEEKIKKAKVTITRAVIGLIIVLAAYSISNFIVSQVIISTTSES